jgi:ACS family allantoate permease-like MFS transporter
LVSIAFFFLVPDSPASTLLFIPPYAVILIISIAAWFLSHEEKVQALERIRSNQQGVGNKYFKKYQIFAALKDPFVGF